MQKEGIAIASTDQISACFRPNRSPTQPNSAPPDGTHEKPGGEGAERGEQRGRRVIGGEEVRADLLGKEAEQREVVPLEHVADEARDHTAANRGRGAELLRDHAGGRDGFRNGGHGDSFWGNEAHDTAWECGTPRSADRARG